MNVYRVLPVESAFQFPRFRRIALNDFFYCQFTSIFRSGTMPHGFNNHVLATNLDDFLAESGRNSGAHLVIHV